MTQVNLISMTTVSRKKHHNKQSILHCNEHLVIKKIPRISNGGNQTPPYYAGFLTHNKIEDAAKSKKHYDIHRPDDDEITTMFHHLSRLTWSI